MLPEGITYSQPLQRVNLLTERTISMGVEREGMLRTHHLRLEEGEDKNQEPRSL